jgi:hypothetical protein
LDYCYLLLCYYKVVYCKVVTGKECWLGEVVKCCTLVEVVGEGSKDYTLGDVVEEELGRSKQVEASFDKDEEDSPGKIGVVHMLGRVVDNNLVMAIV